ncbi:MAG TPA: glycine--tRNA ligase [Dehalococcoidia bacterium]|nr:glycine--tRNA ligase [Dehalococcoidia bacterium]
MKLAEIDSSLDIEKISSLCKRRGFVYQSSEIYGGLASTWDYGPLGVELKRNVKEHWWNTMVWERDDMVGLDASILMHPDTWRASGHLESFTDPLVECNDCKRRYREDHIETEVCPECSGKLTEPRLFHLMFKTFMGPVEEDASTVYLRPETAQGIFVNFNNVINSTRKKLPFGIAQIGKAFRNEITTGNFIFRTREFEMMEIEYFVMPGEDEAIHEQWIQDCLSWYSQIGLNSNNLRVRRHEDDELSHYAKATYDIEYNFPWGWGEIQGIANRTDYDLKSHMEMSGEKLTYFDESSGQHVIPYVIEPSWGVDRAVMALLVDAYCEEELTSASGKIETRVVLKFDPSIAPVKAAVLPLSRNEKLTPLAKSVFDTLRRSSLIGGHVQYDDAQSIGRRYRRQDEIGTPLCVTVDFDSLDDDQVTIRERDSMQQTRVGLGELESELAIKMKI